MVRHLCISNCISCFMLIIFLVFYICYRASYLGHIAQRLVLGFDRWVAKPYYRIKTPLVTGGTYTQVLASSMTIAASELNHCSTKTQLVYISLWSVDQFFTSLNWSIFRYVDWFHLWQTLRHGGWCK